MTSKNAPSVLWREGMLLCPQHLQAFAREVHGRIRVAETLGRPGGWGVARLELDDEALARDVLVVRAAEIVLRDGTFLSLPGASLDQRDFSELFSGPTLDVWLGVPAVQENVAQVGEEAGRAWRYRVEVRATHDENLRESPKEIEYRTLSARLFFGDEDRSGFECVRIARLVRKGRPKARSAQSDDYVPPLLEIGASAALMRALEDLAVRSRSQARDLAQRVPSLSRLSSAEKGADIAGVIKLQTANACTLVLEQLSRAASLSPFNAYLELARIAGELAVFAPQRLAPQIPPYEHERSTECFGALLENVRELLAAEVAVPYDMCEFRRDEAREGFFVAQISQEWIDGGAIFYLGVELARPADEVSELVAAGIKLIPPVDIDRVLQGVVPGIGLEHLRVGPTSFPKRGDLHFFRIETEGSSRDAWLKVLGERSAVLLSALGALGDVRYSFYVELAG